MILVSVLCYYSNQLSQLQMYVCRAYSYNSGMYIGYKYDCILLKTWSGLTRGSIIDGTVNFVPSRHVEDMQTVTSVCNFKVAYYKIRDT